MLARSNFSILNILPYLTKATLLLTVFAYSSRALADKTPVVDFPQGLSFSAGFPLDGFDLCRHSSHCLQAYVFESTTFKPVLQIERTSEIDETSRQQEAIVEAKKFAAEYIELETENFISREASAKTKQMTDSQIRWMYTEIQARAEKLDEPYYAAEQQIYNKIYYAQYGNIRADIELHEYANIYVRFNTSDFVPKYDEFIAATLEKTNSRRANLDKTFDVDFLKNLILNLKLDYASPSNPSYNQQYTAISEKWHHLYFSGKLLFKGQPLHNGVTLKDELTRLGKIASTTVENSEYDPTFRNILLFILSASAMTAAGYWVYTCVKSKKTEGENLTNIGVTRYGTFNPSQNPAALVSINVENQNFEASAPLLEKASSYR